MKAEAGASAEEGSNVYLNEQLLQRLAHDRTRELAREAKLVRQSRAVNRGWRMRTAQSLVALAERLEPKATAQHRNLAGH